MQISRKAHYALRATVILAGLPPGKSMQAQELATQGSIPIKFLEQILLVLKRAGILQSKRGVGGGYRLDKEARHIRVADVLEAIDGELCRLGDETGVPSFPGSDGLGRFLHQTEARVNALLGETTIDELLDSADGEAILGHGI